MNPMFKPSIHLHPAHPNFLGQWWLINREGLMNPDLTLLGISFPQRTLRP